MNPIALLAQQGPPEEKQDLTVDVLAQLSLWVSVAMGFAFFFGVVVLLLMAKEIATARDEGRSPHQITDRLLTVLLCTVGVSVIGALAGFVYIAR